MSGNLSERLCAVASLSATTIPGHSSANPRSLHLIARGEMISERAMHQSKMALPNKVSRMPLVH